MSTVLDLAKVRAQAEVVKLMSSQSILEDNNFLPYSPLQKIQSATNVKELLTYYWDVLGLLDSKLQTLDRVSPLFEHIEVLEGEEEGRRPFSCQVGSQDIIETAHEYDDSISTMPCPLFVKMEEDYVIVCSRGGLCDLQIYLPLDMSHWNGELEVKVKLQEGSRWGLYRICLFEGYMHVLKFLSGTDIWSSEIADRVNGLLMDYVEALQLISIHHK